MNKEETKDEELIWRLHKFDNIKGYQCSYEEVEKSHNRVDRSSGAGGNCHGQRAYQQ